MCELKDALSAEVGDAGSSSSKAHATACSWAYSAAAEVTRASETTGLGLCFFVMQPSAEALINAKRSVEKVRLRRHNLRYKTLSLYSRLALTLVKNWGMRMLRDL